MNKLSTEVTGLVCPKCGWFIYSRARHDFHSCPCGTVSVDGGFDYFRGLADEGITPLVETREIPASKDQLYQDWAKRIDKFGRMPPRLISSPVNGEQLTLFPTEMEGGICDF